MLMSWSFRWGAALLGVLALGCSGARVSELHMPDGSAAYQLRCPRGAESCERAALEACDGSYHVVARAALPDTESGTIWKVRCGGAPAAAAQASRADPVPPAPAPLPRPPAAPAPATAPVVERPHLRDQVALEFFSPIGIFEVYQLGRRIESKSDETYQNGGLRFSRVRPGEWVMFGNLASGEVESHATASALVFVERSPINAFLHVLTIQDQWVEGAGGFRATYVRTLDSMGGERLVTRYEGYARP
jgi:hypothetical protein